MTEDTTIPLKAPFPWFGGKSRAAALIWQRFGPVPNYVEPFAGSLAVLLNRPHAPKVETVNDLDAYLANFWRALTHAPDEVARHADHPVNEADLHARHTWLIQHKSAHKERMLTDPEYYDAKIAGWWVWGLSCWIGDGWTDMPPKKLPELYSARGVTRKIPMISSAGSGVHQLAYHHGAPRESLLAYFQALSQRLRHVRVTCGHWDRILGPSVTFKNGCNNTLTGILLDPPYDEGDVKYAEHSATSASVRKWCLENADNPLLRIALCGLEGEHDMPGWDCVAWKAIGGYANQRSANAPENTNRHRERIWFSPHCLKPGGDLFG